MESSILICIYSVKLHMKFEYHSHFLHICALR
nr:MAG TPA: hypothetical protein [Caudoviricetes sp.]